MLIKLYDFAWRVAPTAGQFCVPFDSTRRVDQISYASLAAGSAFLAPGDMRGHLSPLVVQYSVEQATNDLIVDEQVLAGRAGTSADWETQGTSPSFTQTAAAGATQREFTPYNPDARLLLTCAGGGAATLVSIWGTVFQHVNRGG